MELTSYLAETAAVNHGHPLVQRRARDLQMRASDRVDFIRRAFEWVRDEIPHSVDHRLNPVTWRASDVLEHGTGYCYAKSHLLAALLRANGVPTGLCYQRLSLVGSGPPFSLHGLNAVWLPEHGWYRIDARGNKTGIDAQFSPPIERCAFRVQHPGEIDLAGVFVDALPVVIDALRRHSDWAQLLEDLPDVEPSPAGPWAAPGVMRVQEAPVGLSAETARNAAPGATNRERQ